MSERSIVFFLFGHSYVPVPTLVQQHVRVFRVVCAYVSQDVEAIRSRYEATVHLHDERLEREQRISCEVLRQ